MIQNKTEPKQYEVIVVGGGVGGVSAAIASARAGASTLLIEALERLGGTGVHSPVGIVIDIADASGRKIVRGLHEEFFPELYGVPDIHLKSRIRPYDETKLLERYERLTAAEANLTVATGTRVSGVTMEGGGITSITCEGRHAGEFAADNYVDSTAEGFFAVMCGAEWKYGRDEDGAALPATLSFTLAPVDFDAFGAATPIHEVTTWKQWGDYSRVLNLPYRKLKEEGRTSNQRENVMGFPFPDRKAILFNATRVLAVDPTDPESMRAAYAEGEKQAREYFEEVRKHPAFAEAELHLAPKLGIREGRRIMGDYVLTVADCLGEARFEDMVVACGCPIDIHNPTGEGTRLADIPGSGYYHIPYRCLLPRGIDNLLLGSRCISGTHEAHSSYRVMAGISPIGQAAGVAAALSAKSGDSPREVNAAAIRSVLRQQGQFVEETDAPEHDKHDTASA